MKRLKQILRYIWLAKVQSLALLVFICALLAFFIWHINVSGLFIIVIPFTFIGIMWQGQYLDEIDFLRRINGYQYQADEPKDNKSS